MKTVIDVLKKEARDLERKMGSLQYKIDYKEEELASLKESLSSSMKRLKDIESHTQSLEDDKNKNVIVGAGTFNKETDKVSTKAIISAGEFVLPVKSQIIEEAY